MSVSKRQFMWSGVAGCERCSISAPNSASVRVVIGPPITWVLSKTFSPVSGNSPPLGKTTGSLSPIFVISTTGFAAGRRPTGCARHSSAVRTTAMAPPSSRTTRSTASPSHCKIATSIGRAVGRAAQHLEHRVAIADKRSHEVDTGMLVDRPFDVGRNVLAGAGLRLPNTGECDAERRLRCGHDLAEAVTGGQNRVLAP
jgi:hypothetical protein